MSSPTVCIPLTTENPLRLSPLFTDYWADFMASVTRNTDAFSQLGCYVPRFYHAPDSTTELNGIPAGGYIEYLLTLPVGSFLCGFLHTTVSIAGTAPLNPISPPAQSGFVCQITDLSIRKQLANRPLPEAWFLNDYLQPQKVSPPYGGSTNGFVTPTTPRLLPIPHPIVPPKDENGNIQGSGQLLVEFWNQLATLNTACQLTFLVMIPVGVPKF